MRTSSAVFVAAVAIVVGVLLSAQAAQAGVSFSLSIGSGHSHFGGHAGSGYFFYSNSGWGFGNHSYAWPHHGWPHGPAWHHPGPVYYHGPYRRSGGRIVTWSQPTVVRDRAWWGNHYSYVVVPRSYVYVDDPLVIEEPVVARRVYRVVEENKAEERDDGLTDTKSRVAVPTVVEDVRRDPPAEARRRTGSWADGEWRVPVDERQRVMRDIQQALGKSAEPQAADKKSQEAKPASSPAPVQGAYRNNEAELLHLLRRGKDDQREKAAEKLKRFSTSRSVEALSEALTRDEEDDVREAAAESLGSMLAADALKSLRRAAQFDSDRDVRRKARQAVDKIEAYKD